MDSNKSKRETARDRLFKTAERLREQGKDAALLPRNIARFSSFAVDDPKTHKGFKTK